MSVRPAIKYNPSVRRRIWRCEQASEYTCVVKRVWKSASVVSPRNTTMNFYIYLFIKIHLRVLHRLPINIVYVSCATCSCRFVNHSKWVMLIIHCNTFLLITHFISLSLFIYYLWLLLFSYEWWTFVCLTVFASLCPKLTKRELRQQNRVWFLVLTKIWIATKRAIWISLTVYNFLNCTDIPWFTWNEWLWRTSCVHTFDRDESPGKTVGA